MHTRTHMCDHACLHAGAHNRTETDSQTQRTDRQLSAGRGWGLREKGEGISKTSLRDTDGSVEMARGQGAGEVQEV